jgi:uncharacterized protein DUF4252
MKYILIIATLLISQFTFAQSKVMKNLSEEYPDATTFVIYHSHFTMLNQNDDPDIAALAATIDKIKVLTFDSFSNEAKKKLVNEIKEEGFESLMTIKHNGADIEAYLMEDDGDIEGYFLIVKSEDNTMAIDVAGSPDAKQIGKIIDTVKNH